MFHSTKIMISLPACWVRMEFCTTVTAAERPPNVLFILLDNVGKDWFRCYGSQEDQAPNIDRLAQTGLRFQHCYVTLVCSTSRVMLLTGRYPFGIGWYTTTPQFMAEAISTRSAKSVWPV